MAYYCTTCGTPLDNEGRCPRCDAAPTPSAALGAFTPPIPGPYDHRPKFEPVLPGEEDEGTTVLKSDDMPEFYMEHPARAWQTTAAQPDKTQRREKPRVAVPQKKGLGKGAKLAIAAICILLGVALLVGLLFLTGVIRVKDGAPAAEAPTARDLLTAAFDESCGAETLAGYYISDLDTDGTDDMVVAVAAVNSAKHVVSVRLSGYTVENGQAVQKASFTIGPDVYDGMFGEINTPPSVENGDWAERLEIYVNDAGYISVNTDFRMNEWSAHYLLLRYRYGQLAEVAHLYDPGYTSGTGLYEYAAYSSDDSAVRDAGCLYYADYEGVQGRYTDYVTAINQEFAMYGFTFAAGEGPAGRDVPAHVAEGTGAVPLIRFRNDK